MCNINGKKLQEIRKNAKISQIDLAKMVGVPRSTMSDYENGLTKNVKDETVDKICMILKINRDEIEIHNVGYDFKQGISKTVKNESYRMKKLKISRYVNPIDLEKWIDEKRTQTENDELKEVKIATANSFGIGQKRYILTSPTSLHVPEWQRDTDMAKAKEISTNYDESKFDPVKAYLSNGKLYIADGAHRIVAFVLNGEAKILVELLNCDEQEAVMTFLGQSAARKAMSVNDMYRAGVRANIEDYINLKTFFEEKNIQITTENVKIENPIGSVRPSRTLLRMVKTDKEILNKVVDLIHKLEWSGSNKNAFTIGNMIVLKKMYQQFGDNVENKLLSKCSGATYYENNIFPAKSNSMIFDILSDAIKC